MNKNFDYKKIFSLKGKKTVILGVSGKLGMNFSKSLVSAGGKVFLGDIKNSNNNQECERVKQLLNALKGGYKEYFLDEDFRQQQFDMEFGGDASYPQIQIDYKHIGNLKDTLHYLQDCGKI